MKWNMLLLLFLSLHVCAKSNGQTVSLSFRNTSLEKVILAINKQTGYQFLYTEEILAKSKPITINVNDVELSVALDKVFQASGLSYKLSDHTIVISNDAQQKIVNTTRQRQTVTGIVTDKDEKPLANVSVFNINTKRGTSTDGGGGFSIDAGTNDMLSFTYVGYQNTQLKISNQTTNIRVVLKDSIAELSETVVIGYGSAKKKDLTGSVAVINSKDIRDVPFVTFDNAIAGKAAGVQVTKTDGTPGGAVRIRIRGSSSLLGGNDPLYVIDGVPVQVKSNFISPGYDVGSPVGNSINGQVGVQAGLSAGFVNGLNSIGGLNVDDIESITILKDASATAIYGSKAANGVVIINTKTGKKDMKPLITFDYSGTVYTPIRKPHLLNASQYRTLLTESAQNDYDYKIAKGYFVPDNVNAIVNAPNAYFGKANTDWVDVVTRNTFASNAQIAIQGGGSATRYYSSIAFNKTPGVVLGSDYNRVAGKLNLENEISSRFTFITNLDIGYINQNISNGVYGQALRARPDYSAYDSLGNYTSFDNVAPGFYGFLNPLALTTSINNSKTFSLLGSLSALYRITKDLQFKSIVSLNMLQYNQRTYTPSYITKANFNTTISASDGVGSVSNSQSANWFIENTLTYTRTLHEKHSLNILGGTSYETNKYSFASATGAGYPNDDVLNSLSSAITPLLTRGDNPTKPQSYLLSFYLRANYGFRDKYLITFTGRADGSSKFGPENKFGYFPSGALAWRLSKENFLKNVSWMSDLKIRGSYGITGTQNIGNQMYRTLYSPYNYGGASALVPTQLGNAKVRWEKTNETDLGLDVSLFKDRLQGTFDYYHKNTDGILLSLPVAPSSSYSSLLRNSASIINKGFELSVQGDIIRTRNFRWNASANITWNRSVVSKIDAEANLSQIGSLSGLEQGNTALIQGQPLGLIIGYKVTGVIKTQKELEDYKTALGSNAYLFDYLSLGDPMYELDNGGYPSYKVVIGRAAPKYYGGFTQGISYKQFDLTFYFTYSQGGKLMWGDHVSSLGFIGTSNANTIILNRYTPDNTATNQPRLIFNDGTLPFLDMSVRNTSQSVFRSSYLKLRTVTFNYRIAPKRWMKSAGIQSGAVYLSAVNLFTITKYPGNNPETSDDPYSVGGGYFDASNYPNTRTFTVGLKVGF